MGDDPFFVSNAFSPTKGLVACAASQLVRVFRSEFLPPEPMPQIASAGRLQPPQFVYEAKGFQTRIHLALRLELPLTYVFFFLIISRYARRQTDRSNEIIISARNGNKSYIYTIHLGRAQHEFRAENPGTHRRAFGKTLQRMAGDGRDNSIIR